MGIWSVEHQGWWKIGRMGYTPHKSQAGLYSRADAEKICKDANINGVVNEIMVEATERWSVTVDG